MISCFCCYVIKSAGETAKKVLLTVIWNLMLIEIHLSQIRIPDSKREKVCAVYPYLLFLFTIVIYICTEHQKRWTPCNIWKSDKWGGRLYWRYINVVPLWIRQCQKYLILPLLFIQPLWLQCKFYYPFNHSSLDLLVSCKLNWFSAFIAFNYT